eukprot:CAMPEP_0174337592 /NCGR_PEP_ID=MMETSP0810-20121108/22457_1 /TAXON_ID=73025 ORGANISM="Eutreptiella gymnastica-like, Strain CCMP1594" /NCGR_SAMPLE_ID=MMETSP0810 /ASSEMBLY_ACC=CAM_ASM_000659 /LENGTH=68 /DNA_ID=CAMNT_0015457165 /DNA_START=287 /DNA_END=493 /DNA_ORIENTATION=-
MCQGQRAPPQSASTGACPADALPIPRWPHVSRATHPTPHTTNHTPGGPQVRDGMTRRLTAYRLMPPAS